MNLWQIVTIKLSYRNFSFGLLAIFHNWQLTNGPRTIYHQCSLSHYDDVIMGAIASQTTSLTIVYSAVYSGADQSKHQSSASLAFVWGNHRGPVNSPHKWPVTRKMFPFDDVIMSIIICHEDQTKSEKLVVLSCSWPKSFFQNNWWCNTNNFWAAISGHDWQSFWISRQTLKSTLYVTTNLLKCITLKNIHLKVNIVNLWQIGARWWKNPTFGFLLFSVTNISKMASGRPFTGHLSPKLSFTS